MNYTKNLNHLKILGKTQKNNNLLKTKIILKPKYKLSLGPVFTFSKKGTSFAGVLIGRSGFYCT